MYSIQPSSFRRVEKHPWYLSEGSVILRWSKSPLSTFVLGRIRKQHVKEYLYNRSLRCNDGVEDLPQGMDLI